MYRIFIVLILALFVAGCTPAAEPTPTEVMQTEAPLPSETSPAVDASTPTIESFPTEPDLTEEPPTSTSEPSDTPTKEPKGLDSWIAYISPDMNLWIMNPNTGENIAISEDAVPFTPNVSETLTYCCAKFSSDGSLLAYRKEVGKQTEQAYQYTYSLWVYDMFTRESRLVVDGLVVAYDWKPGEHLIAYNPEIDFNYFTSGDQADQYASGIWAVDVDGGDPYELVAPERGYALAWPIWSPDGRFLSFEEIKYMEGRGLFAYYDVENQEYIAWDEVIGGYDWSPDGEMIAYDTMAYVSQGNERIWLRERTGEAREFSPLVDMPGFASNPVFSPQGDKIAYLAAYGPPETTQYSLMVQDFAGGEPRELGRFESINQLIWSSDGRYLVFAAGAYEQREIVQVLVEDGSTASVVEGAQPALQP